MANDLIGRGAERLVIAALAGPDFLAVGDAFRYRPLAT
jgi:hypothetical protein